MPQFGRGGKWPRLQAFSLRPSGFRFPPVASMTRDWRRGVPNGRQPRRRSDIHDHADLVAPSALQDTRSVKSRGLDDGAGPVAARVERLAVKHAVNERVARREDRDTVDDEAFDLVHVEALVDPGDKERPGRLGLCADLA